MKKLMKINSFDKETHYSDPSMGHNLADGCDSTHWPLVSTIRRNRPTSHCCHMQPLIRMVAQDVSYGDTLGWEQDISWQLIVFVTCVVFPVRCSASYLNSICKRQTCKDSTATGSWPRTSPVFTPSPDSIFSLFLHRNHWASTRVQAPGQSVCSVSSCPQWIHSPDEEIS